MQTNYAIYPDGFTRRVRYDNGLTFSSALVVSLFDAVYNVKVLNTVTAICLEGQSGQGKTTSSIHLTDTVNKLYTLENEEILFLYNQDSKFLRKVLPWILDYIPDMPTKLDMQLGYGGVDFHKKLLACFEAGLHTVIYDEAGDYAKKNTLSQFNKELSLLWDTFRTYKIVPFIVLPLSAKLDDDVFDKGIIKLSLYCFGKTLYQTRFKAYDADTLFFLHKNQKSKKFPPRKAYHFIYENFRGYFLRLSPEREKELDAFSLKNKHNRNKLAEARLNNYLSYDDLARKCGKGKLWVKVRVNKMQIKPIAIINRKKYFEANVLEALKNG